MFRVLSAVALACALHVGLPEAAFAQSIAHASYEKVCDSKGWVDNDKLLLELRGEVDANEFVVRGKFDLAAYHQAMAGATLLNIFAHQLESENEVFYKVTINGRPARTIDPGKLVANPSSHRIKCVKFGEAPSTAAQVRAEVSKAMKTVGERLTLRKDVDNLSIGVEEAEPASFAITNNRITGNTAVHSQFAIAAPIKVPNTSLHLAPYVSHEGFFNSRNRASDIDTLSAGLIARLTNLPVTPWLGFTLSGRGAYVSDTLNDKKIYTAEFVAEPFPGQEGAQWPITLNQQMNLQGIYGGSWIRLDVSARYRYGRVEYAGGLATLDDQSNFSRLGYAARFKWKAVGNDAFAGFGASAGWLFYSNLQHGPASPDLIEKFDAALTYDFNASSGLKLGLVRGRHEDTLQRLDTIFASYTIKFGNPAF